MQVYKNTEELVNKIPKELKKIYEFNLPSMKANLREKGMLSPVVLSKLGIQGIITKYSVKICC